MPEPITVIGSAAIAAYIGKDGLNKLLGPTADYLGLELQQVVQKSHENLGKIFAKAIDKLGDKINSDGIVNPRILKEVYDSGRFCEDEITAEYYAGILAASRGENADDNRGLPYLDTLHSMSSYEIRFHYISYILFKNIYDGAEFADYITLDGRLDKITIRIKLYDFLTSMAIPSNSVSDIDAILVHSISGLKRRGLLANDSYYITKKSDGSFEGALQLFPSLYGLETFLWANGRDRVIPGELFKKDTPISQLPNIDLPNIDCIEVPEGYLKVLNLKSVQQR